MTKTSKIAAIVLAVVTVAAGTLGFLWQKGYLDGSHRLYVLAQTTPELQALYVKVVAKQATISEYPNDQARLLDLGLTWKSLGEQSPVQNRQPFLEQALKVYAEGVQKFGQTNILFLMNAGNVAVEAGAYAVAENYFKSAIKISPADDSPYIALAQLYMYNLKKSPAEVTAVYSAGISAMLNPAPLVAARGSYLRRIGDYAGALPDFQTMAQNSPNNQTYKNIVAELQAHIAAGAK